MCFTRDDSIHFFESTFGIELYHPVQIQMLDELCLGKNIYLSAHTGFEKSIVFQSIPCFFDLINNIILTTKIEKSLF